MDSGRLAGPRACCASAWPVGEWPEDEDLGCDLFLRSSALGLIDKSGSQSEHSYLPSLGKRLRSREGCLGWTWTLPPRGNLQLPRSQSKSGSAQS